MKFDDDDLKDGKLWAALQKEIDRDLTENGNGETFQKELEDIEDSIETENEKEETKKMRQFRPVPFVSKKEGEKTQC